MYEAERGIGVVRRHRLNMGNAVPVVDDFNGTLQTGDPDRFRQAGQGCAQPENPGGCRHCNGDNADDGHTDEENLARGGDSDKHFSIIYYSMLC